MKLGYSHRDFGRAFVVVSLVSIGLACIYIGVIFVMFGGWGLVLAGLVCLLFATFRALEGERASARGPLDGTPSLIRCPKCARLGCKTAAQCFCGASFSGYEHEPPAKLTADDIQFLSRQKIEITPRKPQLFGPVLSVFLGVALIHLVTAPFIASLGQALGLSDMLYPTSFLRDPRSSGLGAALLFLFVVPITSAYFYGYLSLACWWFFLWLRSIFEPDHHSQPPALPNRKR